MWKGLFIFSTAVLTSSSAYAATYYYTLFGTRNNDCSLTNPCERFSDAWRFHTPGDVICIGTGTGSGTHTQFTSTGNPNAMPGTLTGGTHTVAGSWNLIHAFPGSTVTFSGYNYSLQLENNASWYWIEDFAIKNNTNGHAINLWGAKHNYLRNIIVKNGSPWNEQYANVVEIAGDSSGLTTSSNTLDGVWVIGSMRYGIVNGGTDDTATNNLFRKCGVRFDGSDSPEPHAGISNYGATDGVIGAMNSMTLNSITIDFNNADNGAGEGVYAGFYNPHAATDITHKGSMAIKTKERGFIVYEDDGSIRNSLVNCLVYLPNNGTGDGITGQLGTGNMILSQVTVASANVGFDGYNDNLFVSSFSLFMGNSNANDGTSVNNWYWNQATAGTTPISSNPLTKFYTRIESNTGGYGNGTTTRRGADMTYEYGHTGDIWGDPGFDQLSENCLMPNGQWPNADKIGFYARMPDEGQWATDMPGNSESRGFAASTTSLSLYLARLFDSTQVPYSTCTVLGGGDPVTDLSAVFSNVTTGSVVVTWTDSSADHKVAFASDSGFASLITSGTVTSNTTSYGNLSSSTQYWFEVKVASETTYNSSITTTTLAVQSPPSGEVPYKFKFKGGMNIRGNIR